MTNYPLPQRVNPEFTPHHFIKPLLRYYFFYISKTVVPFCGVLPLSNMEDKPEEREGYNFVKDGDN